MRLVNHVYRTSVCAWSTLLILTCVHTSRAQESGQTAQILDLETCIEIALRHNRQRGISKLGVEIAQAQHRQALSAYWPRLSGQSALTRLDDDPLFIFPEETSVYDIAGVLPQPISPTVTIPEKKVKLMDRLHFLGAVNMTYPLYTGGLRRGSIKQAKAGIVVAQQVVRHTDLQIIYDIKRVYYGAVLAQNLATLAQETLERLEITLELTENL